MATKKYKTVSGYLRSNTGLDVSTHGMSKEQIIGEHRAKQRRTINNLLPQLGLPKLDAETPIDGINRLLAAGGTETQVTALKDCQRWLKNYTIVTLNSAHAVPQVKTADGLISYLVRGFKSDDSSVRVKLIVDAEQYGGSRPFEIAQALAGPDYCFNASENMFATISDAAKNRLFFSDEELFAAVPELAPPPKKSRGGISSYRAGGADGKQAD